MAFPAPRPKRPPGTRFLRAFKNIQCRDAVLEYDGEPQPARDKAGNEITVWDRHSKEMDMVTAREVPDETKRLSLLTYANPRPAHWPQADYIVGNPPFIGTARMREELGDGYAETLRATYPDVPESADFVFIGGTKPPNWYALDGPNALDSLPQTACARHLARRVVQAQLSAKPPLSSAFCHSRPSLGGHGGRRGGADCHDSGRGGRTLRRTSGGRRRKQPQPDGA